MTGEYPCLLVCQDMSCVVSFELSLSNFFDYIVRCKVTQDPFYIAISETGHSQLCSIDLGARGEF